MHDNYPINDIFLSENDPKVHVPKQPISTKLSTVPNAVWLFLLWPAHLSIVGECPAVDFETKMYNESLDVLEHHIKPLRRVPGVVLEQSYLNKMAEGLKPLEMLAYSRSQYPITSTEFNLLFIS